jgi:hypothetical protein
MAGLTRKKVRVRGKNGKSFMRSVMVRAQGAVQRHGAKVLAGAALLGTALLAHKNREQLGSHAKTLMHTADVWRRSKGANLAGTLIRSGAKSVASHYGNKLGSHVGAKVGKRIAGKHGREFGEVVGGALGSASVEHATDRHIEQAAKSATTALRRKSLRPKKKK